MAAATSASMRCPHFIGLDYPVAPAWWCSDWPQRWCARWALRVLTVRFEFASSRMACYRRAHEHSRSLGNGPPNAYLLGALRADLAGPGVHVACSGACSIARVQISRRFDRCKTSFCIEIRGLIRPVTTSLTASACAAATPTLAVCGKAMAHRARAVTHSSAPADFGTAAPAQTRPGGRCLVRAVRCLRDGYTRHAVAHRRGRKNCALETARGGLQAANFARGARAGSVSGGRTFGLVV